MIGIMKLSLRLDLPIRDCLSLSQTDRGEPATTTTPTPPHLFIEAITNKGIPMETLLI